MGLAWEPGIDKQTMYLVFVIKTRHNTVSRGNSKTTRKEMSKLFLCDYLVIRWKIGREERNQVKNDGFWLLWGIFNEYIKRNIIIAVLIIANFQLTFADWWNINHVKKDQEGKLILTLIFSKLPNCSWGFKKKECSAYYRILFTLKNIT